MARKAWHLSLLIFSVLVISGFQVDPPSFYTLDGEKALDMPKPEVFRKWELVGTGCVPDDLNRNRAIFPGTHLVYMDPVSLKHRKATGFFPDGTILVMESFRQARKEGVSGTGYFETGLKDILVSIKDRRVFPGNGWSYYLFTDKDIRDGNLKLKPKPKSDCQACHIISADDDEVFVKFYPQLIKSEVPPPVQ